ncbi:MAG: GTPase, partial [Pirellulaceae bacterium]
EQMLDLVAHLEAGLDFVEEDIEFISRAELARQLGELSGAAQRLLEQMERREIVDAEASVVLRGRPNAGKSSLFNRLLEGDHALVSDEAGTTRDYVTGLLSNGGRRIKLIDTAGVDESPGRDEADRMARAVSRREAELASAQLLCLDSSRSLDPWELAELAQTPTMPRLVVLTKCDRQPLAEVTGSETLRTSCVTGEGMAELRQRIVEVLNDSARRGGVVPQTAARCVESLRRVEAGLERAAALVQCGGGDELTAAELRLALDELGAVTGAVYTEDILDRIFGRFCIGK